MLYALVYFQSQPKLMMQKISRNHLHPRPCRSTTISHSRRFEPRRACPVQPGCSPVGDAAEDVVGVYRAK
jgi:hypothetical protein